MYQVCVSVVHVVSRRFPPLGGSKTTVYLCPLSVHHLDSPIVFTSHEQTLTTLGDPKDWTRATLLVKGPDQSTAIKSVKFARKQKRRADTDPSGVYRLQSRLPALQQGQHQIPHHRRKPTRTFAHQAGGRLGGIRQCAFTDYQGLSYT